MLDIGWTELFLIGVVALIVVGPKDLPGMFRTLGRVTARMRSMAREFQRAMDQAADESGVKDVAADLRMAASAKRLGLDQLQQSARRFPSSFTTEESQAPEASSDSVQTGKGHGEDAPAADSSSSEPASEMKPSAVSAECAGDDSGQEAPAGATDPMNSDASGGEDARK